MSFPVIFEDEWLLVIDKPSGQPSQRTADGRPGVLEALQPGRPPLVLFHRLDTGASGLLLLGRSPQINKAITEALHSRALAREYRAVLYGEAPTDHTWDRPVEGKAARTHVRCEASRDGLSAVALKLDTGRKHQIRVHAALAGCPVVGDRRYGGAAGRAWPRLALHAARLSLPHPITGEQLNLTSPIPADLAKLFAQLSA